VASTATIQNILKTLYTQTSIPELAFAKSELLGLMKKRTDFEGLNLQISNRFSGTGGGSADFATAQANISGAKYGKFLLTHKTDYSLLRITTLAARQSKSDKGALVRAIKEEGDAAFYTIGRSMSRTVWGNGGGARGVIGAVAGAVITLSNAEDIVNFEVGMSVSTSVGDGTDANPELAANAQVITAIDEDAGTITAAANWHADFAVNNYLFREGDHGNMATGVDGWIPATAPTAGDNFFGMDRSVHPTRQAGIRYTALAADTPAEALIKATGRAKRSNARPDHCFVHPTVFTALVNDLGAKVQYERLQGTGMDGKPAPFGFKALVLHSAAGGELKVLSDADCPLETAYLLTLSSWTFWGLGPTPGFIDDDGSGNWLRVATADSMEARIGYYGNISCDAPGHNVRVDLSAAL
jgi:hypothetical protein